MPNQTVRASFLPVSSIFFVLKHFKHRVSIFCDDLNVYLNTWLAFVHEGQGLVSGSCPLQGELDLQNVEDYRCLNAVFLLITGGLTELYEGQ